MGVAAKDKKQWLTKHVRAALEQFTPEVNAAYGKTNSTLHVEQEIGEWRFNWFRNRDMRISVMGDPIWYVEILFTGPTTTLKATADNRFVGGIHEFACALFLEYKPKVSTDLFEDMTDAQGTKKGLMIYLKNLGLKKYANTENTDLMCLIREDGDEEDYRDMRSIVNLDKTKPADSDKAHLLTFRAEVCDVL